MRTPRSRFPFIISPYEKKDKISQLLKKMVTLESALDELLDKELRQELPKEDADREIKNLFSGLIPILDSLDSVKLMIEESGEEEWRNGFAILYDKFISLFEAHNFERSAKVGIVFNPELHESVSTAFSSSLPSGTISQIVEQGWLYKGKLLRYARVIVSKGELLEED